MNEILQSLLLLQDRDRRIHELNQEIKDIPRRQAEIQTEIDEVRHAVASAETSLKENALKTKELESDIQGVKDKIIRLRKQQFEIKNNEEYRALEKEIGGLLVTISGREDKEISLMEESEKIRHTISEKETEFKQESAHLEEEKDVLQERLEHISRELEEAKAERSRAAEGVDPVWLSRYERVFQRRRDFAIVPIEGDNCGGCHMAVTPQTRHDARRSDKMVSCTFCGRFLYSL